MLQRQRGIALIQVLLLVALIMMLALQLSYSSRSQVTVAQGLQDRTQAILTAHSVKNEILFAVIADEIIPTGALPEVVGVIEQSTQWQQTPVTINNVTFEISDLTNRVSIRHPSHPLWPLLLTHIGYSDGERQALLQYLTDLQDVDTVSEIGQEPERNELGMPYPNRPLQTKTEIDEYLKPWPLLRERADKLVHHYGDFEVSLMSASADVLSSLFGEEMAMLLIDNSADPMLYRMTVNQLMQMQDPGGEAFTTFPSTIRRITVQVKQNDVLWKETIDVKLAATSTPPYTVVGRDTF